MTALPPLRPSSTKLTAVRRALGASIIPLTAAWLAAAAIHFAVLVAQLQDPASEIGIDRRLYLDATRRWLDTGQFYEWWQLSGPYAIDPKIGGAVLYPPVCLVLFLPFLILPAIMWWLIPLGVSAWSIAEMRPARWTWPILAMLVWWPSTEEHLLWGNPAMFALAALSVALRGHVWTAPAILLKPTLAPFAFVGVNQRSWWLALVALAAISVPFGALWIDWLHATLNITNQGLSYNLPQWPLMLIPAVAWLGSADGGQTVARWQTHLAATLNQHSDG
jgi:hypothetical protein